MKKFLSVTLALIIVLSFAACSKSGTKSVKDGDSKVWYFSDENTDDEELFADVEDTVNPKEIYSSTEFTEEMLYGAYAVNDLEDDIKKLKKELSFRDAVFDNGTFNISTLPVAVYSGSEYLPSNEYVFQEVKDREIAALSFIVGDEIGTVPCSYEINGNKIKYTALTETTGEDGAFSYELDKEVFEYEFSVFGPYLTLSDGKDSVQLIGYTFTDNNESTTTMLRAYSKADSPLIDNADCFVSQQNDFINYAIDRNGGYYDNSAYKLSDDGRITVYFSYIDTDGNKQTFVKQYAYIAQCSNLNYLSSFSVILLDGDKIYYYNDSDTDREARILAEEGADVDNIDDDRLKEIADKKSDLYDDLKNEFDENGITVHINRSTGEISMDSSVLFGGDSAELTDEGRELLNKFIKAYTSIIYDEKYEGFISKTMVEGHIAPVSGTTYEGGMPLSKQRAENVKAYCLSSETGVDTSKLASTMETVGYSQSKPVCDADGNVDIAASRRVSFRFIVNTENI